MQQGALNQMSKRLFRFTVCKTCAEFIIVDSSKRIKLSDYSSVFDILTFDFKTPRVVPHKWKPAGVDLGILCLS